MPSISTTTAPVMAIVALPSPLILNKDSATRIPMLDIGTLSHEIAFVAPYRYIENRTCEENVEATISSLTNDRFASQ